LTIKSNKNLIKEFKELEERFSINTDKLSNSEKLSSRDDELEIHKKESSILPDNNNISSLSIVFKLLTVLYHGIWSYLKKNKLLFCLLMFILLIMIRKRIKSKIVSILNFIFFNK